MCSAEQHTRHEKRVREQLTDPEKNSLHYVDPAGVEPAYAKVPRAALPQRRNRFRPS